MGVCDLWPVAEPTQNKKKRTSLPSTFVVKLVVVRFPLVKSEILSMKEIPS